MNSFEPKSTWIVDRTISLPREGNANFTKITFQIRNLGPPTQDRSGWRRRRRRRRGGGGSAAAAAAATARKTATTSSRWTSKVCTISRARRSPSPTLSRCHHPRSWTGADQEEMVRSLEQKQAQQSRRWRVRAHCRSPISFGLGFCFVDSIRFGGPPCSRPDPAMACCSLCVVLCSASSPGSSSATRPSSSTPAFTMRRPRGNWLVYLLSVTPIPHFMALCLDITWLSSLLLLDIDWHKIRNWHMVAHMP